jgi:N-acetylmuramoyl-L-alanine amidase
VIALESKKTYLVPIVVLILCCLAFLLLSYLSCTKIDQIASRLAGEQTPVMVIDPGHGGEDGGTSGSSVLEKDVNLAISLQLKRLLEISGLHVVMTRTEDVSISDSGLGTVRERKASDIHNRLKIIEAQGENCIFISIHQNHFTESKYNGAQMFYSTKNAASKEIAECIRSRIVSLVQPENKRENKPATSSIFLLWNTKVPAVLVECGFLSNQTEAANLSSPDYQKKLALAMCSGVLDYLHSEP